jgi:cardiolipin synthase
MIFMESEQMNIPNILTIIRILLIPVFCIVYFSHTYHSFILAVLVFLAAGITDILDGYIARKYNLKTELGAILDPLADKLMITTVLFCLYYDSIIPLWIFILILVKEIIMIAFAAGMVKKYKQVIHANYSGKAATLLFYISICMMIFSESIGRYIIYIAVAAALYALANYIMEYLHFNKKTINNQ